MFTQLIKKKPAFLHFISLTFRFQYSRVTPNKKENTIGCLTNHCRKPSDNKCKLENSTSGLASHKSIAYTAPFTFYLLS